MPKLKITSVGKEYFDLLEVPLLSSLMTPPAAKPLFVSQQ
jgi:hypothetical protein